MGVTVISALTASLSTYALSESIPLGISTDTTFAFDELISLKIREVFLSGLPEKPIPKIASTRIDEPPITFTHLSVSLSILSTFTVRSRSLESISWLSSDSGLP